MNGFSLCAALMGLALTLVLVQVAPVRANETGIEVGYTLPDNLKPEERKWYETFQNGNMLADGWLDISRDILGRLPAEARSEQTARLRSLGDKIGREWCKDNKARRIDTGMLKAWGKQLKDASKKSPEALTRALAIIDGQVDKLVL